MLGILEHINLDPVIIEVAGPLALRWYGLMYVLAFVYGYFVFRWLQKIGYLRISADDVTNYIVVGVLGTFLGGRLGYLLFYQFDYLFLGDASVADRLAMVVRVWEGGMSFHGGVIGVIAAVWIFARRRKHNFWNVTDGAVHIVPFGVAMVRVGNFINGELYGRAITDDAGNKIYDADKLPWYAMKFPTDPEARARLKAIGAPFKGDSPLPVSAEHWERIQHLVPGRYPSQIVQFAFEGVLLLLLVWVLRRYFRRPGLLGSFFLVGYAIFRIPAELIRQPDSHIDPNRAQDLSSTAHFLHSMGLTMGQFLSVLIFAAGLITAALISWRKCSGEVYTEDVCKRPRLFGRKNAA